MNQRTHWREHADYARRLRLRYLYRFVRGWWQRWRGISRIEAELRALDARELSDMGLAPGDIPAVARGVFLETGARRARGQP